MALSGWSQSVVRRFPFFGDALAELASKFVGPFAGKVVGLSAFTAAGQAVFVVTLPTLSRLYTPEDFGLFTIFLSIVNIGGPIVGLKFDSALYADRTREEAARSLALSLVATLTTTGISALTLFLLYERIGRWFGSDARTLVWFLPLGLLLSGLYAIASAWAIKKEAVIILGTARLAQPAMMTVLQLAAAVMFPFGGFALIAAHVISYIGYSGYIFLKTLTRKDLAFVRGSLRLELVSHANARVHFPVFLLPAALSSLAVSNLPPLLLSSVYGAEIAGYCGVAFRLIAAPFTIASTPLGAVFTGIASRTEGPAAVLALARKVFLANFLVVCLPTLLFGLLATKFAPVVMGEAWEMLGKIIAAFAVLGAARALAAPFGEVTSIFRTQSLKFGVEAFTASLVVGAIALGAVLHWSPLTTIWVMASLGAVSTCLCLALVWWRIRSLSGARR